MAKKNNTFKLILTHLITDIFEKHGNKPMNYKQVAAKLNLNDPDARRAIGEILQEESKSGLLHEVEKGKFILRELKVFITGRVDLTADGSAYIVTDDEFEEDI